MMEVPMNASELKALKPKKSLYRRTAGGGLYIEVTPNGSKLWRHRYRYSGRENMLTLGKYPKVSLKEARRRRDEQRDLLDEGKDPSEERRYENFKRSGTYNFKVVAEAFQDALAEKTRTSAEDTRARFVRWVYPYIGNKLVDEISFRDVMLIIQRIEFAGRGETARRTRAAISRVFRYAMARGMVTSDPTPLKEALKAHEVVPYPNVTDPKKLAGILKAIDGYDGQASTKAGLQLLPMLLCRPGELRTLRWDEVHEDEIKLDESRTKQGQPHIIPLSNQAKAILSELHEVTGHSLYVFPGVRSADRCMSDNTLNAALRRMGYTSDELVSHSFRKIGSTMLHEQGYDSAWIERQLGHTDRDKIRAVYNHAQHLEGRRKMMQAWSDYLTELKSESSASDPA
ncbi:MAG: DUF4102 domain-containing protein [Gammaproteobacteria bacterium]|nr:MAG: DUF4102 domain-containing protein [Gammaproteobacteria bacterium]